jgi:hypothetical protein
MTQEFGWEQLFSEDTVRITYFACHLAGKMGGKNVGTPNRAGGTVVRERRDIGHHLPHALNFGPAAGAQPS